MKYKFFVILTSIFFQLSTYASIDEAWLWSDSSYVNESIVSDPVEIKKLITFLQTNETKTIYLDAFKLIKFIKLHNDLKTFIHLLKLKNINVELLFGDPGWIDHNEFPKVINLIEETINFINKLPIDYRPTAIHLDIEPHVLDQWKDEQLRPQIARNYFNLIETLANKIHKSGINISIDAAFFFDEVDVAESEDSLAMLLIPIVDKYIIMAYKDIFKNIIEIAETEILIASRINKKNIYIALETQVIDGFESTTHHEEGISILRKNIHLLKNSYRFDKGFAGVAVHNYKSLQQMAP